MPSRSFPAAPRRLAAIVLLATLPILGQGALVRSALAEGTSSAGGVQTPTQPTANDPSVGLPSEPATMTKNPEAMSPHAARDGGTAPVKSDSK